MNVMMIRAKIKAENVAAAQAATEKVLELIENLKGWYAEPPAVEHMTVIGSYQLF